MAKKDLMSSIKPGSELFVIASGSARVTLRGKDLATLYPGDAFGEMALLDGGRGAQRCPQQHR